MESQIILILVIQFSIHRTISLLLGTLSDHIVIFLCLLRSHLNGNQDHVYITIVYIIYPSQLDSNKHKFKWLRHSRIDDRYRYIESGGLADWLADSV